MAVPALLQQSLMHSDSARSSQTIIHPAHCKDLNEKLPECSSDIEVEKLLKVTFPIFPPAEYPLS